MAFSRTNLLAAVAGTLSVAVLAGCPATPGQVGPSTTPSTTPSAGASTTPTSAPSASPLESTTVRGNVYDEAGALVSDAKLRIESLNPSNPFDSTVDVISGSYVANGVPAGVQLRLTATKDGYAARSRVETLLPLSSSQNQIVNFGSTAGSDTAAAAYTGSTDAGKAYWLSDTPEVSSVEPADKATGVAADKVSVKLTLSEPLDQTNRNLFASALRLTNVAVTETAKDATTQTLTAPNAANGQATVSRGSIFNNDQNNPATVTWDAEGKVATLTFNAPILGEDKTDGTRYYVTLDTSGTIPADDDGNDFVLGSAFRVGETNRNYSYFNVARDSSDPTLESATIETVSGGSRLALTFSEPMAVYSGTSTANSVYHNLSALLGESGVHLVVDETASDISTADGDLDEDPTTASTSWAIGQIPADTVVAFDDANFTVSVNSTNPKVVYIAETTPSTTLDDSFGAFKVWVGTGKDPAGNDIVEVVKSGTF